MPSNQNGQLLNPRFLKPISKNSKILPNGMLIIWKRLLRNWQYTQQIKPGELQLPFRIMLVGEKSGPPVFDIAALLGKKETTKRINNLLDQTGNW